MVPVGQVFDIEYGNKLDANKQVFASEGINFVSRSSKNLGVVGKVEPSPTGKIYEAGLITVTLGGTYLLSAFVQPEPFYTAQNIKVLRPLAPMTSAEKAYYCECIRSNRFRYSTHGREANRSFDSILVPSRAQVPSWVATIKAKKFTLKDDHKSDTTAFSPPSQPSLVRLDKLFAVKSGLSLEASARSDVKATSSFLPYLRPSKTQTTSFVEYADSSAIDASNIYPRHTLYVSTNGQGSHTYAYVSTERFVPNSDVSVLIPDRQMALQEKLFYAAAITANRFRFSYGRKPKGERLKSIVLPEWAPAFVYSDDLATSLTKDS